MNKKNNYKQYSQMEIQLSDSFGKRLQHFREFKDLTRAELAEKLGYEKQRITKYENGYHIPNDKDLNRIASLVDTNPLFLKYGIDVALFENCKEYIDIYNQCFETYLKENKLAFYDLEKKELKQY